MSKELFEGNLTIRACGSMTDWYALQREGVTETSHLIPSGPNSAYIMDASRLDPHDACVEGTRAEWLDIAEGLEQG